MENSKIADPMQLFAQEAPEVAQAFGHLIEQIRSSGGLDEKTKQLIYIAMKAAAGDALAAGFHVMMAKNLGAQKAEVIDALLVTLTVCGISGVAGCLPAVVNAYSDHASGLK